MKKYSDAQLRILEKETIICEDVVALLDDVVANDIATTLRRRLDDHMLECQFCQEMDESYRLTIELAFELRDTPIPNGVQNRLREALNKRLGLNLAAVK